MFLSDNQIRSLILDGTIVIEPFDERLVRPASICLRLGSEYLTPAAKGAVDIASKDTYPQFELGRDGPEGSTVVPPRSWILASTLERIALPRTMAAWISNLSGLARLGLGVGLSSFVSPGFGEQGPSTLALEISNRLEVPIHLRPRMRICHLVFLRLEQEASRSYDSQVGTYSHQTTPRTSVFYSDLSLEGL